jgi:hypothetical protein
MKYEIWYAMERKVTSHVKVETFYEKPSKKYFIEKAKEIFKEHDYVKYVYIERFDDDGDSETVALFRTPKGNAEPTVNKIWKQ